MSQTKINKQPQDQLEENNTANRIRKAQPSKIKQRCLGISIILLQIGVIVGYAINGEFYPEPDPVNIAQDQIISLIAFVLLLVLGFGMLLSAFRYGSWLGPTTVIIVVSITLQYGPLLENFFFSSILLNFGENPNAAEVAQSIRTFWRHFQPNNIQTSFITLKTAILTCLSLLTVITAMIGRLTLGQIIKLSTFFSIFWNINYFLLIKISISYRQQLDPIFFDASGVTFVFLFGSFFGLVYNVFLWKQKFPSMHPNNQFSQFSIGISAFGSLFIYLMYVFLLNEYVDYDNQSKNTSHINLSFGLASSVIGTYTVSILLSNGKVGMKECLLGITTGGVILASITPIIQNIGESIAAGLVSGGLCSLYMQLLHKKINRNYNYDSLGLFGSYFIASFLGAYVAAPISITIAISKEIEVNNKVIQGSQVIGIHFAYAGISTVLGMIGGAIIGILNLFEHEDHSFGQNSRYFTNDFGLQDEEDEQFGVSSENDENAIDWQEIKRRVKPSVKGMQDDKEILRNKQQISKV